MDFGGNWKTWKVPWHWSWECTVAAERKRRARLIARVAGSRNHLPHIDGGIGIAVS
jgi:hypothetical protein